MYTEPHIEAVASGSKVPRFKSQWFWSLAVWLGNILTHFPYL